MLKDILLKKVNLVFSKRKEKQQKNLEKAKKAKDADINLDLKKVNTRSVKPRKEAEAVK